MGKNVFQFRIHLFHFSKDNIKNGDDLSFVLVVVPLNNDVKELVPKYFVVIVMLNITKKYSSKKANPMFPKVFNNSLYKFHWKYFLLVINYQHRYNCFKKFVWPLLHQDMILRTDWFQTTLYTRLLLNFTKRAKKNPFCSAHSSINIWVFQWSHYTQKPFKNVVVYLFILFQIFTEKQAPQFRLFLVSTQRYIFISC